MLKRVITGRALLLAGRNGVDIGRGGAIRKICAGTPGLFHQPFQQVMRPLRSLVVARIPARPAIPVFQLDLCRVWVPCFVSQMLRVLPILRCG